ncbi:hypothetical protein EVAR_8983_1 [Eumeta japonica]|uniref:Uncharacterized protein n=1 Tax=Eumeta variegata TaxID=151549 RepID=A0A4C1WNZ6_EUMVA|nr:hypothetical protein EVAR_8983_1 [Eumeta japonica]
MRFSFEKKSSSDAKGSALSIFQIYFSISKARTTKAISGNGFRKRMYEGRLSFPERGRPPVLIMRRPGVPEPARHLHEPLSVIGPPVFHRDVPRTSVLRMPRVRRALMSLHPLASGLILEIA